MVLFSFSIDLKAFALIALTLAGWHGVQPKTIQLLRIMGIPACLGFQLMYSTAGFTEIGFIPLLLLHLFTLSTWTSFVIYAIPDFCFAMFLAPEVNTVLSFGVMTFVMALL